jgi:hypothetical protein
MMGNDAEAVEMEKADGNAQINNAPNSSDNHVATGECEDVNITCISDLILMNDVPTDVALVSLMLGATQTIIYFIVIFVKPVIAPTTASYYALAVALLFAAFAISSETMEAFNTFLLNADVKKATNFSSSQSDLFRAIELFNQALFIATMVASVPQQNDPLSIVLNCTGLLAVAGIDNKVFECLKVKGKMPKAIKKELDSLSEKRENTAKTKYFLFTFGLYCGLLFYSLDYNNKL